MTEPTNPASPVVPARLANFLASPLPNEVKAALAAFIAELAVLHAEDPEEPIPPAMLLAVNDLQGGETMLSVDLLHVLRGYRPNMRRHTARDVGAALRCKREQLGRPPAQGDMPMLGRVSLFAAAYWGGIDAWAAGAAARVQRPKFFWHDEANQLDTLRDFAARHPGRPITTVNLDAAGYHALAVALRGADLDALVAKAGLGGRNLRRDPAGPKTWTADVVVDRYVALCRQHAATLSNPALLALGGEASSLRGHAQRLFGHFGAMVDAARARAPELQPLNRPTAADGTALDSWSEVVVWNALSAAFPGADLRAHVVLPGEVARSADILVAGAVYVEVVMVAVAKMATPTSGTQAAYARKWSTKVAVYMTLGIDPVVIEPADIHDPARLALRVEEIGRRIGIGPCPPSPPTGKQTRAKGSWDDKFLRAAVAEIARLVRGFPTYAQLTAHGYGHAAILLRKRGMRQRVAEALGLRLVHRKNIWDRARVVAELLTWVGKTADTPACRS